MTDYKDGVPEDVMEKINSIIENHLEIEPIAFADYERLDGMLREISRIGAAQLMAELLVCGAHPGGVSHDAPEGSLKLKFGPFTIIIPPPDEDGWREVKVDLDDPKYSWR